MNKLKKIGLSALAGSLVAVSAQAYEITMTGGASVSMSTANEKAKTTYGQADSITFAVSGETDGGLTITTSLELDGGANASSSFDSRSLKIAHDELGTLTFSGHGGSSVMSGWDDKTPSAYEESWGLTTGASVINGVAGDSLWRYDSPALMEGLTFHAAYQSTEQTSSVNNYTDFGVQFAPSMAEGLTMGYAMGEVDESTAYSAGGVANDVTGIDETTFWLTYVYGPVTIGYQQSDADGPTSTQDDESTAMGISYAVSDALTLSYNEHEIDLGSSTSDQNSSGVSASYTMGGTTIKGSVNSTDNVAGAAATDVENYEVAVSFAF
jgi:outer membrane protein OmpU